MRLPLHFLPLALAAIAVPAAAALPTGAKAPDFRTRGAVAGTIFRLHLAEQIKKEMLEAVRHAIGADSLGYISLRGLVAASEQPSSRLCTACFDGQYPIELPGETALGKNVIEHMLANAARGAGLDDLAADEVPVVH